MLCRHDSAGPVGPLETPGSFLYAVDALATAALLDGSAFTAVSDVPLSSLTDFLTALGVDLVLAALDGFAVLDEAAAFFFAIWMFRVMVTIDSNQFTEHEMTDVLGIGISTSVERADPLIRRTGTQRNRLRLQRAFLLIF